MIKDIYKKNPTAGSTWKEKRFPKDQGQGCPSSAFLFNTVLEVTGNAIKQGKETKCTKIGKEQNFFFAYYIIVCIENPKSMAEKLWN